MCQSNMRKPTDVGFAILGERFEKETARARRMDS